MIKLQGNLDPQHTRGDELHLLQTAAALSASNVTPRGTAAGRRACQKVSHELIHATAEWGGRQVKQEQETKRPASCPVHPNAIRASSGGTRLTSTCWSIGQNDQHMQVPDYQHVLAPGRA